MRPNFPLYFLRSAGLEVSQLKWSLFWNLISLLLSPSRAGLSSNFLIFIAPLLLLHSPFPTPYSERENEGGGSSCLLPLIFQTQRASGQHGGSKVSKKIKKMLWHPAWSNSTHMLQRSPLLFHTSNAGLCSPRTKTSRKQELNAMALIVRERHWGGRSSLCTLSSVWRVFCDLQASIPPLSISLNLQDRGEICTQSQWDTTWTILESPIVRAFGLDMLWTGAEHTNSRQEDLTTNPGTEPGIVSLWGNITNRCPTVSQSFYITLTNKIQYITTTVVSRKCFVRNIRESCRICLIGKSLVIGEWNSMLHANKSVHLETFLLWDAWFWSWIGIYVNISNTVPKESSYNISISLTRCEQFREIATWTACFSS